MISQILYSHSTPIPRSLPLYACYICPILSHSAPCLLDLSLKQSPPMLSAFSRACLNILMPELPSLAGWPSGNTSSLAELLRYLIPISSVAARRTYMAPRMLTSLSTLAMHCKVSKRGFWLGWPSGFFKAGFSLISHALLAVNNHSGRNLKNLNKTSAVCIKLESDPIFMILGSFCREL